MFSSDSRLPWLHFAALLFGLAWLLPNHQLPWTGFHADLCAALGLAAVSAVALRSPDQPVRWPRLGLWLLVLCLAPLLQWASGRVHSAGTAWLGSLYLLGLALAVWAGSRLQQRLADALFLTIALAGLLSVSIQLCQWSGQTGDGYCGANWMVVHGGVSRFYANFNQPNQLASLLLWGLLACAWGHQRGKLHGAVALVLATLLVAGLVLTGSRTAVLSYGMLCALAWYWRRSWRAPSLPMWAGILLIVYGLLWLLFEALGASGGGEAVARTMSEPRPQIWKMFLQSLREHPWLGYGWNQSLEAQMTGLFLQPGTDPLHGVLYAQSHNLFIDLLVWLGAPLGLLLTVLILRWVWRRLRQTVLAEEAIVLMAVLVIGLHAMLEFPLYYAYFLLPTGLFVGMLEARGLALRHGRGMALGLLALAGLLVGVTVRDYFAVEESFDELRLERARIVSKLPRSAPEVLLLTQLRDTITLARLPVDQPVSDAQLAWIRGTAMTYPTPANLQKLIQALQARGETADAQAWAKVRCLQLGPALCQNP